MPIAVPQQSTEPLTNRNPAPSVHEVQAISATPPRAEIETILAALSTAPVDLGRISDYIRSNPELANLILRITDSLLLVPENSIETIEEAVVVLGTGRLRALIELWQQEKTGANRIAAAAK